MRLQSLPRCRAAPGARARGAAVLRWCSPQSSVPRQTVGHHARAAMYEMGLTAACEGHRGEVPRQCLDIPPAGALLLPSHIPTGRGAVGRTARRAEWWISQSRKTHLGAFCKKWAREHADAHLRATDPRGECGMPAVPREAPDPTSIPILLFPGPRRRPARPLLIYPPAGAQWSPRPGGLSGGFPNPAKLIWVRSAKNGLASSRAREMQRGAPGPWPDTRRPRAGRSTLDRLPWTVYPGPSTLDRLPCTVRPAPPALPPTRLPCAAPPEPCPDRLPWTARPPAESPLPARLPGPVLFALYIDSKDQSLISCLSQLAR